MKLFLFTTILFFQFNIFSQNDEEINKFDIITKPGVTYYTKAEKLSIDSFNLLFNEYKNLENQIIDKISKDSISKNLKRYYIDQYVCNIPNTLEKNSILITNLIKKDFLLFSNYKTIKGKDINKNCITSPKLRKLVAFHIIENNQLFDCNFFDQLNYFGDTWVYTADKNKISEEKSYDRNMNIFYTAKLLFEYKAELEKVVSDKYANECYRKNAKLILEALDKNK